MRARRAVLLVLDSVGVGALPDAHEYGDEGADTLGNVARSVGGLRMPNLGALGLGNIIPVRGVPAVDEPGASFGRAAELGVMKDTVAGHWELMGLPVTRAFPTYPDGFPHDLLARFDELSPCGAHLGGSPASGTVILTELGAEHLATGAPIVYTSADSVFQIAAHDDVMSESELHALCERVRDEVCVGEHGVARIIARPFTGPVGEFVRTAGRKDYALAPSDPTLLDALEEAGVPVLGIGKISDVFGGRGVTETIKTVDDADGMDTLIAALGDEDRDGFIFCNLNDFDMKWGHRNDAVSYARGLEYVDERMPEVMSALREGDLFMIVADHGCDPTDASTDHTREYIPILATIAGAAGPGTDLGVRDTFADVGATIGDYLEVVCPGPGRSFLGDLGDVQGL